MNRYPVGLVIGQLHRGGAEKQLVALALGLRDDRMVRPVVYCLSEVVEPHGPRLRREGVELRVVPARGLSPLARLRLFRSTTRDDRIALLHAFLLGPVVQSALISLGGGAPVFVASNRTGDLGRPVLRRLLESWALNRARVVTVNSTAALRFTRRYYRIGREKLRFIPNGIDPRPAGWPDRGTARSALDLPPDARVVLGLFRLSPEKDLECFCDVAESVLRNDEQGICLVAGDGPLRGWLEERAAASPMAPRMRVLGARDDVPHLLAAADLMLLTSRLEGMPNGVLEAMTAGLPVVATDAGGVPDLLEDGVSGFVRPVGDRQGLIDACRGVLQRPDVARRVGAAARARADAQFSNKAMIDHYRELYRDLLTEERGG